jgi:hypothetical protein
MGDWLVSAVRRPLLRKLIRGIGLPTPVRLDRDVSRSLAKTRVGMFGLESSKLLPLLPSPPLKSDKTQSLLVDLSHCSTSMDVANEFLQIKDAVNRVEPSGKILFVSVVHGRFLSTLTHAICKRVLSRWCLFLGLASSVLLQLSSPSYDSVMSSCPSLLRYGCYRSPPPTRKRSMW